MSTDPEHSNAALLSEAAAGGDSTNLYGVVDRANVYGLNLTVPEDAKELIKPFDKREDEEKFVESGVDDQVVIHVPFVQRVRVRSIVLKLGRGDVAPTRLRIYVNHPSIVDFNDAGSMTPQLNIALLNDLSGTGGGVAEYPLRTPVFANVNTLSLFFSDAVGEEQTRIYYIGFKGERREPVRDPGTLLDIPAQNAADSFLVDKVAEKTARHTTIR